MKRKPHTPDEKAKLVIEVLKGERTINEIAAENEIHPNMLTRWKKEAIEGLPSVFENSSAKKRKEQKVHESELDELYAQIGKLTTQNEWLKKNLVSEFTASQRRNFVDFKDKQFSVLQQAELLEINRSSLYYKPVAPSGDDLFIKTHIDKLYTAHPEFGYRRICAWLNRYNGISINHKAVLRHMREMGIQAVYPRENTSKPNPANLIYPYLLKGLNINHPNHVWSIDLTYITIRSSWLYLVAIIDWYSRYVLDWMLDDTMDVGFVIETSRNALEKQLRRL